jgi:hypothetical protein
VVNSLASTIDADVVLYDCGPNIGPLNRVILLDCDFFAIPAAADLFSIRAIKTLGASLAEWISEWLTISELAPENVYLLPGKPKLLGYIPQRFRVYGHRPATDYASMFPRIERAVQEDVLAVLKRVDASLVTAASPPLKLGEAKDFGTLANASQQQGVPLDKVRAGTQEQRDTAQQAFDELVSAILLKMRAPAAR